MSALDRTDQLPIALTSFVGREAELAEVKQLLGETQLLTLTGAGGCGKSRLALEAVTSGGPVPEPRWVDLAPIWDSELVPHAVMTALELQEIPFQSFEQRLIEALRDAELLLVFDNCEHVIEACATLVREILISCPQVRILATSREPLGVDGESSWRVPSLSVPPADAPAHTDLLMSSDAAQLFYERAKKTRPNFRITAENASSVAEICRRLDGIPLAIELAAARVRLLSPAQIEEGLGDRFRLLTGGSRSALPRQQTLLASIEWSYRLLSEKERLLLRRLAVFAGSFTLDSAEEVCSDGSIPREEILDLITGLYDKSLLQTDEEGQVARYRMLETIRQYCHQKLIDAEEMSELRDRHLSYYAELAEESCREIEGGPDLLAALGRLDLEYDDLRGALDWATSSDPRRGLRIARSLFGYWYSRALLTEGVARSEAVVASAGGIAGALEARVLASAAVLGASALDATRAGTLGDRALSVARSVDDPIATLEASYAAGAGYFNTDPTRAKAPLEEAHRLAVEAEDHFWTMRAKYGLAVVEINSGDLSGGRALMEEALDLSRRSRVRLARLLILFWCGQTALEEGDLASTDRYAQEAAEEARAIGNVLYEAMARSVGANADIHRGHYAEAAEVLGDLRRVVAAHPHPLLKALLPYSQALLDFATGVPGQEDELLSTIAFFDAAGARWFSAWLYALRADLERIAGRITAAEEAALAGLDHARASGNPCSIGRCLRALGDIRRSQEDIESAEESYHEALSQSVTAGARLDAVRALEGIAACALAEECWVEAARLLGATTRLRDELGSERSVPEAEEIERALRILGERLDQKDRARAWHEGTELDLDGVTSYATRGRGERKRPSTGWKSLTPVETDVVRLVAEGLTNAEIGQRLFIAPGTVKNHLSHIFAKLGISTRAELAAEAVRRMDRK